MKKTFLTAIVMALFLSSCNNQFYQVYKTETENMSKQDNNLIYENKDCKIFYDLWSEDGNAGFIMQNKTDKDLFLILSRSFFIKNGEAYDYFKNRERSSTEIVNTGLSASINKSIYGVANVSGSLYDASKALNLKTSINRGHSSTLTIKERPIICIPAKSSKYVKEYSISDMLTLDCNTKQAYPKKESMPMIFTKEDTPLSFKNIISYSYNDDGSNLTQIENNFWVSEIINYSRKAALEKKEYKRCKGDVAKTIYLFKIASPNKFYNSYKKGM